MENARRPLRAVVDTNLVVSGLLIKRGLPYQLISAWNHDLFTMIVSELLLAEYAAVLPRKKFTTKYGLTVEEIAAFTEAVLTRALKVSASEGLVLSIRDDRDRMVVATALAGEADYVVTGDEDLLVLRDEPKLGHVEIVTAREFLRIM